jgi:tetratricopeptide (TPR) repeat protein
VLPTVLGLLGLPVPDGVHGRDLGPALRGESVSWTPAAGYAESLYAQRHHGAAPLVALREQRWKLVRGVADELYDLHADAGELRDVAPVERARTDHLAADLDALLAAMEPGETELVTLDEESRRALQSLGYSWGGSSGNGAPRDPREALVSMRLMADADRAFLAGDVDRAVAGYRQVLDSEPHSVDARVRLAELLLAAARGAEAVGLLAEAVVAAPHEPVLHHKLGYTLEKLGRCEEGLAAYDAGLSRHPAARELRDGRWRCLNQLQRLDEMLGEAESAIALDPTDGMARFARAVAWERELADLPGNPILEAALAAVPVAGADQ